MFVLALHRTLLLHCIILFIKSCKDMDELSDLWCCYVFCTVFHFNKEKCWLLKATHNLRAVGGYCPCEGYCGY